MATLVLSTIGTALGGPVGGAIGALIGQSIDQQLLGPPTRGPRLGDLKVQSSAYGTQIPRIYGSMRAAGVVVWATDLVESQETSGAKGQPDTTYSYSVSMAVALSSRTASAIGRIWADGKLLRGATGDFKIETGFRFYTGSEDQSVDPLIGSVEGLANTPAYRGLALAVFEDLQLAEFGNRIPFLTFEVLADDAPASIGGILNDASHGLVACTDSRAPVGYAAYGQSIKAAIEPLIDGYGVELFDDGAMLRSVADLAALPVGSRDLGNSSDGQQAPRIEREQEPSGSLPSAVRLGYYDPALDYQAGEARATCVDKRGSEDQRELPAAVSASDAKSLVQRMIARDWARRDKLTLRLPSRYLGLQPGSRLALDLRPRTWSVEQCTIDGFVVIAELRPTSSATASIAADAGRIVANDDAVAADVTLALFDIPDVFGLGSTGPTLILAASSPSRAWKSLPTEISAGQQSFPAQSPTRKSVLGSASTLLAPGDADVIDAAGSVEVELVDPDQWLLSCDDDALVDGTNLAVLGSELLQFGVVEPLAPGRFRLSRLVRGRGGTEWATGGHAVGDPFAMIERDSMRSVAMPVSASGANVSASVRNVSGTMSSSAAILFNGESSRPLSPVQVEAAVDAEGNLLLSWTRRSRQGFAWIDEIDVPLGESRELYRVRVTGPQASVELETNAPALQIPAADLAGIESGPMSIEVRQIGDFAASRPATRSFII